MLRPTNSNNSGFSFTVSSSDQTSRNREQAATTGDTGQTNAVPETTVSLSQQAREYIDGLRQDLDAITRMKEESAASRKAEARSRIEAIKREIERLKALLMRFGGSSSYILKQLKQLSAQLGQAAAQLGQSDGPSSGSASSEGATAYSSIQALSDGKTEGKNGETAADARADQRGENAGDNHPASENTPSLAQTVYSAVSRALQPASERQADAQSLKDVVREMRSLLAMLKSKMREHDKNDRTVQKDEAAVQQQLNASEQTISQMDLTAIL